MRKTSEKNRRQLKVRLVAAAVTFGLFAAQADVWEDCAWRLGEVKDANANGVLDNGDVTEYFHAANPADGAHQIKTSPVSTEEAFTNDLVVASTEVMRVTEGVRANQNVLRFRRPVVGNEVYSGKVTTPCQLTGDAYTVICRFRLAAFNPAGGTSISWVFSSGWCWNNWKDSTAPQGGNGIMFGINAKGRIALAVGKTSKMFDSPGWSYRPESWYKALTTETWIDAAIVSDGKTVRVYCSPESASCRWWEYEPQLAEDASLASAKGFCVNMGGEGGGSKGDLSSVSARGFCGDIAELAAWNRALSKCEVVEALGNSSPALFRVGTKGRTKDFYGNARVLSKNETREIPFTVQPQNDGLPQLLRFTPAADSAAGRIRVAIDDNVIANDVTVEPGKMCKTFVKGKYLAKGVHVAKITCLSDAIAWDVIDLCGSFGYDLSSCGGDMSTAIADAYAGDNGLYDMANFPCAAGYEGASLITQRPFRFHWSPGDLAVERFTFGIEYGYKNNRGDEVEWRLLWNGSEVSAAMNRVDTSFEKVLDGEKGDVLAADNVFAMDTDTVIDSSANAGVFIKRLEVRVKKPRAGLALVIR